MEDLARLASSAAVATVFDSVMRKLDTAQTTNQSPAPSPMQEDSSAKAEKYTRTTALLLRAQQLETQLKQRSLAARPDNMEGTFSNIHGQDRVGEIPTYTANNWDDEDGNDFEDTYNNHGLSEEDADDVERNMLHAEKAKQNVRRYKKEADARRKRRLMMESAESDALAAKIKQAERRRQQTIENHEEQRTKSLHDRLEKQRRQRAQRNRRRDELFAAEKRIRQVKPKPLHKRMEEKYKSQIELPELERRKKRLAEIHNHFTKNSPDIPELDMRQRAHHALQRLSGERDHHKRKGKERTWMETRVWYHGQAKNRVLKEDNDVRTAAQRKKAQLKMQLERKKAYAQWVKKVAPPQIDADKVGEMQSRVERLRNPAPKKTQRDRAKDRRPRRKKDRANQEKDTPKNRNSKREGRHNNNDDAPRPQPHQHQRPPAPASASTLPPDDGRNDSSPGVPGAPVLSTSAPLSHPEDLSARAAQLAARARELRRTTAMDPDNLDENFQHAKLQNMYLASMQTQLEAMADSDR
jgi:hypothetical protein